MPAFARGVVGAALTVSAMSAVSRLLLAGKELAVAARLGTSDAVDVFLVAYIIPSVVVALVITSFNSALIPTYVRVAATEGKDAASELYAGVLAGAVAVLSLVTIALALGAPLLLRLWTTGFSVAKTRDTIEAFYILLPLIPIGGVGAVCASVLYANQHLAFPALTPSITPIVVASSLFIVRRPDAYTLAIATIAGMCLETVVIATYAWNKDLLVYPDFRIRSAHVADVGGQYLPVLAGSLLMSSTALVDQAVAANLPPGSVALLNYGNKLVALPLQLAAVGIGTAVIPHFSEMVARADYAHLRNVMRRYLSITFITTVPFAVGLAFFSHFLVAILLGRGAFTAHDVGAVARVFAYASFQIPFYLGGILLVRMISAVRENRFLFYISALNVVVNIVLDLLFMRYMGVAGIALSTSVVYFISFICCWIAWGRTGPGVAVGSVPA